MDANIARRRVLQSGSAVMAASALAPLGLRALASPASAAPAAGTKPNVLFLIIEDCSPRRFGCYGNTICKTPNIDKLAAGGIRFDNAHTVPPCGPSRTALLTGRRPTTTKVFGNFDGAIAKTWFADHAILPELFKDGGYDTIKLGKCGHYDKNTAWTEIVNINQELGAPRKPAKPGRGPVTNEGAKAIGSGFGYGPTGLDDADEGDGRMAECAVRRINAKREKPFFMAVGFHSTHLSFRAPDKYFDMYPADRIEVPKNPGCQPDGMPTPQQWEQIRKAHAFAAMGGNNPGTLQEWKEAIAAHYACLTFVDAQIGRILDALDKSGQADNTIVVIWSDHGFVLGEHFTWRKGQMLNESTQSALVIRAPGVTKAGSTHKGPVECMDLHPTLLDMVGLKVPADTEAASLRPAIENPDRPWRKAAMAEAEHDIISIVTDRYRYTEIGKGEAKKAELYDQQADPGEFTNLAADPRHAPTVAQLSALIKGGWKACL